MPLLSIGEIFGFPVDASSQSAKKAWVTKPCPFRGNVPCTKASRSDPLGICSFSEGNQLTTVCPFRFLENGSLFRDAGRLVFGTGARIVAVPEIRILHLPGKKRKKIGKVDYLIARETPTGSLADFAAIEVQSVYISGASVRGAFHQFLDTGMLPSDAKRRPDFRSSAQKRLMPQLSLKVPVFRRWGKKFFVAVDRTFFSALPDFRRANSFVNSEVTWLVYPFSRTSEGEPYHIGKPEVVFSEWGDLQDALREGVPPSPQEILDEIAARPDALRFTV